MCLFLNILFYVLIGYVLLYTIYFIYLSINALLAKREYKYKQDDNIQVFKHISIIIYCKENLRELLDLVNLLKNQEYPPDRYDISILLDNPSAQTSKVLDLMETIKIWKLSAGNYDLGSFPALSWYFDKTLGKGYTNAYVILSSDDIVKPNFLKRVNAALMKDNILLACHASQSPSSSLFNAISYLNRRIQSRIVNAAFSKLNLGCQILPSGLIFTQNFLEETPFKLSPLENEIDYNFKLLKSGIKVKWAPEVIVYNKTVKNAYDLSILKAETFYKQIKSSVSNFKDIIKNRASFNLFLFFLAPPSILQFLLLSFVCLSGFLLGKIYPSLIICSYVSIIVYLLTVLSSFSALLIIKSPFKYYKYWIQSAPVAFLETYLFLKNIGKVIQNDQVKIREYSFAKTPSLELYHGDYPAQLQVIISDGKKNLKCLLKIDRQSGYNRITILFKDKKFTTNSYASLDQAFDEINNKLKSRNFRIICCYNCGKFNYSNQSYQQSIGEEGYCFHDKQGQNILCEDVVKIWLTCNNYIPEEYRDGIIESWKNSLPKEFGT